jgi:putative hemolysin
MTSDPSEHRRRLKTTHSKGLAAKELLGSVAAVSFAPGVVFVFGAAAMQGASPKMLLGQPLYLILAVFALVAIIALNAHFVMAETALNLLKSSLVKAQDKAPDKMSDGQALEFAKLSHLLDFRDIYTAGAFMGSQTMRAWLFLLCLIPAYALEELMTPETDVRGFSWILLWMIVVSIPVAGLNVLFGELIPKSYASTHSTAVCVRLYGFIRLCAGLFTIPTRLSTWFAGLFTQKFGASASFALPNYAEEEIKTLIETYGESGHIEEEEIEMLDSVFEFGDSVAVEIMTPRVDLDSISCERTVREAAEMIQQTGHSRLPVYEGTDDRILGIIHAKDLMQALLDGKAEVPLSQFALRPAVPVPENKSLHDLLQEMRNSKTQLVIVQDDFGGTAGIVTIEDIVEEVMGDIVDEYDVDPEEVVESEGGFIVLGKMHLDDVNDECGTSFSSEDFDTLGGYVFGLFGRQPEQGESIEHGGWRFTVSETDGRRIIKVMIESKAPEDLIEQLMPV